MKKPWWTQAAALLCSTGVLVACGGGGGDGGNVATTGPLMAGTTVALGEPRSAVSDEGLTRKDSSPTSDEIYINKPLKRPYSVVDLGIASVSPSRIDATLYERSMMPNTALFGTGLGDMNVLNGRTLYLFASEPVGMFQSAGGGVVTQPAPGIALGLQGNILQTAGSYTGAMKVWACLDAACNTRLRNVPYDVPYAVSVLRGYRVPGSDRDQIAVYDVQLPPAVFGQPPPSGQLVLIPPERAPFASLKASVHMDPSGGVWGFDSPRKFTASLSDNGNGSVTVTAGSPSFLPAALYSFNVSLTSMHREGNNSAPSSFTVRFTQEVQANPHLPPVVFDPPNLTLTVASDASQGSGQDFEGISGNSLTYVTYEGVEYLFTAEQEALIPSGPREHLLGVASPSGWRPSIAFRQSVAARNCIGWWDAATGSSTYCLPAGTYVFRLRYRLTNLGSGTSSSHYLPGTIQVIP